MDVRFRHFSHMGGAGGVGESGPLLHLIGGDASPWWPCCLETTLMSTLLPGRAQNDKSWKGSQGQKLWWLVKDRKGFSAGLSAIQSTHPHLQAKFKFSNTLPCKFLFKIQF